MFVLLRHARAVNKHRWPAPDHDRPLDERGRERAQTLVTDLGGLGIRRLLSSSTVRCRHTLAPLSEELFIPVEPVKALGLSAPARELLQLLESSAVDGAVLCTHGENLKALAGAWASTWPTMTGHAPPDIAQTRKGGFWIIDRYNTLHATGRYDGTRSPVRPPDT